MIKTILFDLDGTIFDSTGGVTGSRFLTDGAENLLFLLSRDYDIYLLSNGESGFWRDKIARSGIEKYVRGVFLSQELGASMPCCEFFERCFELIDSPARKVAFENAPKGSRAISACSFSGKFSRAETMIVGNSLKRNIQGGRNAGITTVWYNPLKAPNDTDTIPHHEISYLLQLSPLLHFINGR